MNQDQNHWLALYLSGQYPGNYKLPNRFDIVLSIRQLDGVNFSDTMISLLKDKGDIEFFYTLLSTFETLHSREEYENLLKRINIPYEVARDPFRREQISKKLSPGDSIGIFMDFDSDRNILFKEVFCPAIEEMGYVAGKADERTMPAGDIHASIQDMIDKYSVFIVDISGKKPNKFIELGELLALKKNIILLKEEGSDRPFNISGLKMIDYMNASHDTRITKSNHKKMKQEIKEAILKFA